MALRFLYIQVPKRGWSDAETPYPKKVLRLPQVLGQQEAARLIDAAETAFHRVLIMTLYATGARRVEVDRLKIADSQGHMHRHVGNPVRPRIDMAASGTRRGNFVRR